MNVFPVFHHLKKRTNNANNATHYVKLGKKRRESSKRNYYIISPRVIIKAIIIIRRKIRLSVRLKGRDRDYCMGTKIGMLGGYGFQGQVTAG